MSNRLANRIISNFIQLIGASFIAAQEEGRIKRHHPAGGEGFYVYSKDRETVLWITLLEPTFGSLAGSNIHGRWRVEVVYRRECIFSGSHIDGFSKDLCYAAERVALSECQHLACEVLSKGTFEAEKKFLGLPL